MSVFADGLRRPRFELWSAPEAAGGTLLHRIPNIGPGSELRRSLRGDGGLRLVVPMADEWAADLQMGHVIQVHDDVAGADTGEIFTPVSVEEYRVRRFRRVDGADRAAMPIEAVPIIEDLTSVGPIYRIVDGLQDHDMGELTLTWREAWDDLIVPFLADLGISWWEATGSIGGEVTVNATRVTPLALLQSIGLGLEIPAQSVAQHNGATSIHIHPEITGFSLGQNSPTRKLNVSVDNVRVVRLADDQRGERTSSVAVPLRVAPEGNTQALGLEGLVFEVTNVAGSVITLSNPEGTLGSSLIRFDDQLGGAPGVYPNHYLVKADGTFTEINDTGQGADTVTVASATGISVGDLVEIRRNASGDPPIEAINPAALALGRSVIPVVDDDPRGRNYARNPWYSDWPGGSALTTVHACRLDGTYGGGTTSVDLKDLPADLDIPDNSRLMVIGGLSVTTNGAQSADGSGLVTLALDAQILGSNIAGDRVALLFIDPAPDLADYWSDHHDGVDNPTGSQVPVWAKRDLDEPTTDLSAAVATTVTLDESAPTVLWHLDLKGLSSGQLLQPGDLVVLDGTPSTWAVVLARATADVSGNVTLTVSPRGTTWTLDDPVTIVRPDFAGESNAAGDALVTWDAGASPSVNHGWTSGPISVPFRTGWVLRARAVWAVMNNLHSDISGIASGRRLRLALLDSTDGSEIAATEDDERTFPTRELTFVTLTVDHEPTTQESYQVLVNDLKRVAGGNTWNSRLTVVPLEVSLSYAPVAYTLEGVEYSRTNVLYRRLVETLVSRASGRGIEAEVRDIAYSVDETPDDQVAAEKIVLGAPWFLRSEVLGLDARPGSAQGIADGVVRVVRYTKDLYDLTRAKVVLAHDVFRLSQEQ